VSTGPSTGRCGGGPLGILSRPRSVAGWTTNQCRENKDVVLAGARTGARTGASAIIAALSLLAVLAGQVKVDIQ